MYLAALILPDMRNLSSLFPQSWLFASVSQQTNGNEVRILLRDEAGRQTCRVVHAVDHAGRVTQD